MTIEIYREFALECAHRLPQVPEGHKCARLHGHTYVVQVYLVGPRDPVTGWVVDYAVLDSLWAEHIHAALDHRLLNEVVGLDNPTCENIGLWIASRLVAPLAALGIAGLRLASLVIHETERDGCRLTFETAA